MPIFIDHSEHRESSSMPQVKGSIEVTGMELICGADALVSTLAIPPRTKVLIQKHADSGALFVQIKRGGDLPSSIGDRLNTSLAKMFEVKTRFAGQRILLYTGMFCYTKEGGVQVGNVINIGTKGPYIKWYSGHGGSFKSLMTAVRMWALRGGVSVIGLPRVDNIADWLIDAERDLKLFKNKPIKEIINLPDFPDDPPDDGDILQLPKRVTDGRRVLAALPNIGPTKANAIWEVAGGDLVLALTFLLEDLKNVRGIGKKTREATRKFFGLKNGMELVVRYKDNYKIPTDDEGIPFELD